MDARLRDYILARDGDACVARFANSGFWAQRWPMLQGLPEPGLCFGRLTLDHVKTDLAMSKKAPDDPAHLWCVCTGHHTATRAGGYQWATNAAVRDAARQYIARANEMAAERGWPVWEAPGD